MVDAAQIRASEDLVRIIRQMQDMWIFGKLDAIPDVPQNESQREDLVKLASQLIQGAIEGQNGN
jgi:5,10-methylenetetrahydrofolate reductase